jgi:oligopeptide transport system substrate-binding protein
MIRLLLLSLSLFLFMPSCTLETKGREEGTFVICNGSEPETLNPQLSVSVNDCRIARAIFEGLVSFHPETLVPEPGCAAWTVSEDGRTYCFKLNADAKWSDGSQLTADDFVYSWKLILTKKVPASYVSFFFFIDQAESFYRGRINDFGKVGIKAVSEKQLTVTLTRPVPYFPELLANPVFFPINRRCVEKFGSSWTQPGNMISNGAFVLKDWKARQKVVVEKSKAYHGAEHVKLQRVEFLPYDNLETSYQLFLKGQIDWLPSAPTDKNDEIKFNPDYYVNPYLGTYFYRFNCSRPPFDNKLVRQAFSLSVNRAVIVNKVLGAGEQATSAFCPPIKCYKPAEGLGYNPKKARALLKQSGYAGKFPEVELFYNTSENQKKIAEAIVEQWRENLGVRVLLRNSEWKTFLADQKSLNYDISRSSWIGDYNDPETFMEVFVSDGGNNRTGWKNAAYDDLFRRSRMTSGVERNKIFNQMERLLVRDELPIIPIYYYINRGFISERVEGWHENSLDIHPLKYISVKKQ